MIRVVVTGGRDYADYDTVQWVLDDILYYNEVVLAHGGARGADTLAGNWAESRHVPVTVYPADWDQHGKAAGMIRNRLMLDDFKPDLVVAFPGGRGTAGCVAEAQKRGIDVTEVWK